MHTTSRSIQSLTAAALAALACAGAETAKAQETFDQAPPNNWNPTIFVDRWAKGGTFVRRTLAGVACVPVGALPIAQGGDKEGVYTNAGNQTREAYALLDTIAANAINDTHTEMFVHLCPVAGTNSRTTVGLAARVQLNAAPKPVRAYMAILSCQPASTTVWLRLIKDLNACLDCTPVDNIVDAGDTLSGPWNVGTIADNYRLVLEVATDPATGLPTLTAEAQSISIDPVTGMVVFGALTSVSAIDAAPLPAGHTGVVAFAPFGNQVFWDDSLGYPASGYWNGNGDIAGGSIPGDFNGDGFVTGQDLDDFVAAFEAGEPSSDFDQDGFITGTDFDSFIEEFQRVS